MPERIQDQPAETTWLTTEDVMARLKVSRRTVERLRKGEQPRLPTFRAHAAGLPRFRQQDVDALMESQHHP
jgi:hypothetical protein